MARFFVRNSLNPNKVVRFDLTFEQIVLKGSEGDPCWVVEVNTTEPSISGTVITPEFIHLRTLDNLDEEIEGVVNNICVQIDWSPTLDDTEGPFISSYSPTETEDVDIDSSVTVRITETLPSAGIDESSISVTLDGFDITLDKNYTIEGGPYEYEIRWSPSLIVYDEYE